MTGYTQAIARRRRTDAFSAVALAVADRAIDTWHRMAERRRIRKTVATLRSLEDHMLRDIGVERSEIVSVATRAADHGERWRHAAD